MASVWVPFTSESKEAIAHYPEIIKEIKLAIQECGRKLSSYVHKKRRVGDELKKRGLIEKYLPHVSHALVDLLELSDKEKSIIESNLAEILEKKRGQIESLDFDEDKNKDYDENLAGIGSKKNVDEYDDCDDNEANENSDDKLSN
jgi:DNA topoisomerase VI subunit B